MTTEFEIAKNAIVQYLEKDHTCIKLALKEVQSIPLSSTGEAFLHKFKSHLEDMLKKSRNCQEQLVAQVVQVIVPNYDQVTFHTTAPGFKSKVYQLVIEIKATRFSFEELALLEKVFCTKSISVDTGSAVCHLVTEDPDVIRTFQEGGQ